MNRPIVDFHLDPDGQWVAHLECGHTQHVRHDPPWQVRPWTTTAEGRAEHVGTPLACTTCDDQVIYDQARTQGLCHDGATEVVRSRRKS